MKNFNLVCIHGNSLCPSVFSQIEVENAQIHRLTLPGHDGKDLGKMDSFLGLVDLVAAEIKHLDKVILFGLSLGGHICHHLLDKLPEVKAIMTIAAPPISLETAGVAFLPHPQFAYLFMPELNDGQLKELADFITNKKENSEKIQKMLKKTRPEVRQILGASLATGGFKNEIEILKNFQGKKVFVHPKKDVFINGPYIRSLNLGDFVEMEGGHVLPLDNPAAINEELNKLVKSLKG